MYCDRGGHWVLRCHPVNPMPVGMAMQEEGSPGSSSHLRASGTLNRERSRQFATVWWGAGCAGRTRASAAKAKTDDHGSTVRPRRQRRLCCGAGQSCQCFEGARTR